jgi:hypothetical protein
LQPACALLLSIPQSAADAEKDKIAITTSA